MAAALGENVNSPFNRDASLSSDVPLKPAHPLVDRREESGSEIGKLGVGFARFVLIR